MPVLERSGVMPTRATVGPREFRYAEVFLEDSFPYLRDLRYESLIVFIYDDSASVQEHDTTRRALMEIPGVVDGGAGFRLRWV
jgi:hypothetical protein